jgi:alkylhydroperoxidase family enzyme
MAYNTLLPLLQPGRKLDPKLRELVILRTAIVGDSKFEFSQHMKVARMVGIPEEKLTAIKGWKTNNLFSPAERAVMAATDEILSLNRVEDETFAALQQHLSDPEILELFVVSGTWRMHGLIVRALHLEYDNDTTARLKEVPAPATKE